MMNIYYRFRKRPFILCFWTMLSCVYSISIFPTVVFGKEGESIIYMQNLQVTGQVKDIKGEPLPGVTVTIKGTKRAVTTNTDGKYTITNVGKSSVLLFSFLGFETQERTIGDNKIINVALKEVATGLNEVVVIGYGSVKRGDLTGAVGQVKIEDMEKAPVISFEQALAGRIAGVDVSSSEGQPGEEGIDIVIRGGNSLTQSNAPLYVIDGFPTEDSQGAVLNPDDIESITILKDASATAIYGARGANGVVVIETKKGKVGKTNVAYSGSIGISKVTNRMEMMSPYEFVKFQEELNATSAKKLYYVDDKTLESYRDAKGVNWQDLMFQTGSSQIHNLSVRGGSEQTKFSISGSLYNMDGVLINSGQKRYQGRVVLDHSISKKLKTGVNVNYSNLNNHGSLVSSGGSVSSNSYMYRVWGYRPVTAAGLDDDNYSDLLDELTEDGDVINASTDTRVNPIISAKNELRKRHTNSGSANAYLSWAISPALTFKSTGGVSLRLLRNDVFYNSQTRNGSPKLPGNSRGVNGSVRYAESSTWLNENTLSYKKNFNRTHNLDAIVGFTMQGYNSEGYGFNSQLIANEILGMSGLDTGTPYSSSATSSNNTLVSFLGRINYGYKSKYLFTASIRADGSSKFPADNRWGYFPSGAFAWKMKTEPFMKSIRFISDAKLRMSYGLTGNNRVSDFAPLPSLSQPYANYYSFNNSTPSPGISPNNMGNGDLKWETTAQLDIGYDLSLFKERIGLEVDVYRKITSDLLLNADVPLSTGFSSVYRNIGKIRNQGLEITLNTVNIKNKKFSWETNFNISFNDNKIQELVDDQPNKLTTMAWQTEWNSVPLYIAEVGGPAAMFYGYIWDGVYQKEDFDNNGVLKKEIAYHGTSRELIKPGDIKYRDLDGDGVITSADQTILGRALPIHSGGINNNFSYKGFSLNIFFQWRYGNNLFNANRILFEGNGMNRGNLNQFASYTDRWTPDNPSNTLFRVGGKGPTGYYSSRTLEDGSYLRLKTIQLAYKLPSKWIKNMGIGSLSMNVSAQNLITWTNYSGMDPEVSVKRTNLTPGFDFSAYPMAKTIVFGLKAGF